MTTTIEDGLTELILAQPEIRGAVGDRVYPNEAPEKSSFPRIVYSVTGNSRDHVMSGADGLPAATFTLECQGSYDEAKNIAEILRLKLDGYRGYAGQHFINGCFFEDQSDQPYQPVRGEEKSIKARVAIFEINYTETVSNLAG